MKVLDSIKDEVIKIMNNDTAHDFDHVMRVYNNAQKIVKKENANPYFLCLEGAASLCLGISAFHIRAYPFIIANTFSFINVIIIASISLYRKFMSPPLSH